VPFAWLKVHLVNVNPVNSEDEVYLVGPWESAYSDRLFYGKQDTTFIKKIGGGIKFSLFYTITKKEIETKYRDSILVKGLDTLTYPIRY
jgi:hypothetical protein